MCDFHMMGRHLSFTTAASVLQRLFGTHSALWRADRVVSCLCFERVFLVVREVSELNWKLTLWECKEF